ncbi:hypothetical protein BD779DRAFT_1531242, partial [Infundibulicybe gibba]
MIGHSRMVILVGVFASRTLSANEARNPLDIGSAPAALLGSYETPFCVACRYKTGLLRVSSAPSSVYSYIPPLL